jgi:hypothetical protein
VAAQEVGPSGIQEETQEGAARPAQHDDKGHQGPFGPTDAVLAEVSPLCRHPDYAEFCHIPKLNMMLAPLCSA